MYKFGKRSLENLSTCHPDLQKVLHRAIKKFDFSVIEGHRTKAKQEEYFQKGTSRRRWPNSKHNTKPSLAVDVVPWPIDWNDIERFKQMAEVILKAAKEEGVELTWGGNWKTFKDYPHFQLKLRICNKCEKNQPISEYSHSGEVCNSCMAKEEKVPKLKEMNKGDCGICGKPGENLQIDRDPKQGHARGLLCGACKLGLDAFESMPNLLQSALNYLKGKSNKKTQHLPEGPSKDKMRDILKSIEKPIKR